MESPGHMRKALRRKLTVMSFYKAPKSMQYTNKVKHAPAAVGYVETERFSGKLAAVDVVDDKDNVDMRAAIFISGVQERLRREQHYDYEWTC